MYVTPNQLQQQQQQQQQSPFSSIEVSGDIVPMGNSFKLLFFPQAQVGKEVLCHVLADDGTQWPSVEGGTAYIVPLSRWHLLDKVTHGNTFAFRGNPDSGTSFFAISTPAGKHSKYAEKKIVGYTDKQASDRAGF